MGKSLIYQQFMTSNYSKVEQAKTAIKLIGKDEVSSPNLLSSSMFNPCNRKIMGIFFWFYNKSWGQVLDLAPKIYL